MPMRSVKFGLAMCEVMGLDPAMVSTITVKSDARDILRVNVDMYTSDLNAEQLKRIADALKADDSAVELDIREPAGWTFRTAHDYSRPDFEPVGGDESEVEADATQGL